MSAAAAEQAAQILLLVISAMSRRFAKRIVNRS
jgi:hypothetical protein